MASADAHQLATWREEQHRIASAIVPQTSTSRIVAINNRYKLAHPNIPRPFLVGGVDVSFDEAGSEAGDVAVAVYVILRYTINNVAPEVVYRSHKWYTLSIPYVPSYLAFREIEPLMELITSQLESKPKLRPHVILVDGNGQWHERRAGIASFVGVRTGIPTVGVGKTFYSIGREMRKDDVHRDVQKALYSWYASVGSCFNLNSDAGRGLILDSASIPTANDASEETNDTTMDDILTALHRTATGLVIPMKAGVRSNEILAYALVGHGGNVPSTKKASEHGGKGSKNPIYISVGSNTSLEDAVVLCALMSIARIPEPVREADLYGRQLVRDRTTGD